MSKQSVIEYAKAHDAEEELQDWFTVLQKKKAACTETAWRRRLLKMKSLVDSGQDLKEVLARSADSGWTGLFEVRNGCRGTQTAIRTDQKAVRETAAERRDRLFREQVTDFAFN